jgi:hypothetical protein
MANAKLAMKTAEPATVSESETVAAPISANNMVQELKVTGHMMALPAGLYCIVNESTPGQRAVGGLPGVRISPPPKNPQNIEITSFRADGWLDADGDAALVRVRRAPGHILVTIYQTHDQPEGTAPKLQVRRLMDVSESAHAPVAAVPPAPPAAPERMDIMAHIQTRGDVGAKFSDWLGERGSGHWIEGFAIAPPDGVEAADLSYQAVLGRGWLSPWVEAGQYCGSRGMALPLLGLRVRLTGKAAELFDLTCSASFVGGGTTGPVGNDETCEAETLAPLESIRLTLIPSARKSGKGKR